MKSSPVILDEVGPEGYRAKNPWPAAAYGLIKDTGCASVVYEPGFINQPAHESLWRGNVPGDPTFVGHALGTGIWNYLRGKYEVAP
jgi:hypothetical protein